MNQTDIVLNNLRIHFRYLQFEKLNPVKTNRNVPKKKSVVHTTYHHIRSISSKLQVRLKYRTSSVILRPCWLKEIHIWSNEGPHLCISLRD